MASLPAVSNALATPFRGSENETSSTSEIRQRATLLRRPSDQSEQSSQPPSRFRRRRTPDSGTFGPRSPLPPLAEIFYTHGGCWNLVLAIHDRTRLPIEVYCGGGRLRHAYVVDGDTAIDARGRNELRIVRAGAERTRVVQPPELLEMLSTEAENGAAAVAVIQQKTWTAAASRAAERLMQLV